MAPSKLLLFSVFLALSFTGNTAYPPPPDDGASDSAPEVADSSLALQLQQLKSRVSLLESSIDDKNLELRKKDESIKLMEKVIQEKSNSIALLQSAIESVQVHGGWLPHTFGVHVDYFQTYIVTYWNELGRPAFNLGIEKALKMKARGEGWAEIIVERIRTNWIPRLKKQSLEFKAYLEPNIRLVTAKTVDVYRSSRSSIGPLVFKAQNMADPYIQEAKKYTEPYIDRVAMVTKPHLDKLHIALKPYTEKVHNAYRKVITTTTFLHHEVKEILKNNELTQPVASMELAWFAATALLALPAVFLFKLYSAIFENKTKKRRHSSYANHTRRRLKRAHPGST